MEENIRTQYVRALDELEDKLSNDEDYMKHRMMYREVHDELMEFIPQNMHKRYLELDWLEGYMLTYYQRHFFVEGWKKCLEYMSNK